MAKTVKKKEEKDKSFNTATDKAFRISLYLKALNGLLEIAGGIILLIISPQFIDRWAQRLTQGELSQDPKDFFANHILKTAHSLKGASLTYGAIYLLSHGIAKLVLIIQVLRDRLWAYPALMVLLGLFVVYQTYQMIEKFSVGLLLLSIFDLIIIYLTAIEYKKHKARHETKSTE